MSLIVQTERRSVRQGTFDVPVRWIGSGRPLLYIPDLWGDLGELDDGGPLPCLADDRLVLAPGCPGFDGVAGLEHLDDVNDLAIFYLDLLDELSLSSPYLIGHGFGGMVAAEIASLAPERIAKLVLIGSYGLWLESSPIADIFALPSDELAPLVWSDGIDRTSGKDDPDLFWRRRQNLAAAAKFLWPIPDKGLRKRIHRLAAPTLLLWGERDGIVPPIYARAFQERLHISSLHVMAGAGHAPHLEQPEAFASVVLDFLDG